MKEHKLVRRKALTCLKVRMILRNKNLLFTIKKTQNRGFMKESKSISQLQHLCLNVLWKPSIFQESFANFSPFSHLCRDILPLDTWPITFQPFSYRAPGSSGQVTANYSQDVAFSNLRDSSFPQRVHGKMVFLKLCVAEALF